MSFLSKVEMKKSLPIVSVLRAHYNIECLATWRDCMNRNGCEGLGKLILPIITVDTYASNFTNPCLNQERENLLSKVLTVRADYISGFGKVVIIISVFDKSALRKMYGLHIDAAEYSLCLNAPILHSDLAKPSLVRHYIMRHIFKWFYAIQKQILCIQQISPM